MNHNSENFWWEIIVEGESEELLSIVDMSGSIGSCFDGESRAKVYYLSSQPVEYWIKAIEEFESVRVVGQGKIENRPWHTEWQDAFPPLDVGEGFVVLAPWHRGNEPKSKTPIYIYPATAFGTGYHESTQIALTLLERNKHKIEGAKIADIGTGSGVLMIAAVKLRAESSFARDIDPTVLDEVRNNMKENAIEENSVKLEVGDLLKGFADNHGKVKILTANILFEPLCSMLPEVPDVLDEEGVSIFAGLLVRERDRFLETAGHAGLKLVEEISKNEWWGASFCLCR